MRRCPVLPGVLRAPVVPAVALALLVTGCSGSSGTTSAGTPAPTFVPPAPLPTIQHLDQVVDAQLAGVPLRLEVADDEQEREVGLMGRTSVPPGTGMVFRFPAPTNDRFYMFRTLVPLVVVFVRDGAVVGSAQMTPCTEQDPNACATYGPDVPYDTAVETAPETLPSVHPGDRLVVTSSQQPAR